MMTSTQLRRYVVGVYTIDNNTWNMWIAVISGGLSEDERARILGAQSLRYPAPRVGSALWLGGGGIESTVQGSLSYSCCSVWE